MQIIIVMNSAALTISVLNQFINITNFGGLIYCTAEYILI